MICPSMTYWLPLFLSLLIATCVCSDEKEDLFGRGDDISTAVDNRVRSEGGAMFSFRGTVMSDEAWAAVATNPKYTIESNSRDDHIVSTLDSSDGEGVASYIENNATGLKDVPQLNGLERKLTTVSYNINSVVGVVEKLITQSSDSFRWNITPMFKYNGIGAALSIRFNFEAITITNSELRVYDHSDDQDRTLWSCISCGQIPPPTLASTTGTIIIKINSNNPVSFAPNYFRLRYISSASRYVSELNTTVLFLTTGYDKILPILIDKKLPRLTRQIWNITTPKYNPIVFSFSKFKFGTVCLSKLEIYDDLIVKPSNLIYRGCVDSDSPKLWIYAQSGRAIVILQNSHASVDQTLDFRLTYRSDTTVFSLGCGSIIQPDVLIDNSMIISDGSSILDQTRRSGICTSKPETCSYMRNVPAGCSWLIEPEVPGSTITLILRRVSMKIGSSIQVFDSINASGPILWNYKVSRETLYTIPPPIISTGSSLFILFRSNFGTNTGFRGFVGEYQSNYPGSIGMGSGESHLAMATAHGITPPGHSTAYLTPKYTCNLVYKWYINVSLTQENSFLIFSLSFLSIPLSDSLIIYDGDDDTFPVIVTLTGSSTPYIWYRASSKVATIKFMASDPGGGATITNGGFKLNYYIDGPNYHCGFTTNPLTMTASSMMFTDGSMSNETLYKDQYCEWIINPIDSTGVYIFFNYFGIFGGSLDVYIGDPTTGQLHVSISQTNAIPVPIVLHHPVVSLVYRTSKNAVGVGFSATYFGLSNKFSSPGDNIIKLSCSTSLSIQLENPQSLSPGDSLLYHVKPRSTKGNIYFFVNSFKSAQGNYLEILNSDKTQILATIDSISLPNSWLSLPPDVYIKYNQAATPTLLRQSFDISFYSDGSNSHCGFLTNPAILESTSMYFTDGSPADDFMYTSQYCEWVIRPPTSKSAIIVLELIRNDLRGAVMTVYDGESNSSGILWQCDSCQYLPHQLISRSGVLYITFQTSNISDSNNLGKGFSALYYTVNLPYSSWRTLDKGLLLESPNGLNFDRTPNNQTAYWAMRATSVTQTIKYSPFIASSFKVSDFSSHASDGRLDQSPFKSSVLESNVCGFFMGDSDLMAKGTYNLGMASIVNDGVIHSASQSASSYLSTSTLNKSVLDLSLSNLSPSLTSPFKSLPSCKFLIDNEFTTSFYININNFFKGSANSGRIQVFTGVKGDDNLAFDSSLTPESKSTINGLNILAPCGRATVLVYLNESRSTIVNHHFDISFTRKMSDEGDDCRAYIKSLHPQPKKVDPWLYYKIAGAAFGGFACFICIAWSFRRRLQAALKSLQFKRARVYASITPLHPKYTPKLDEWKNKWLLKILNCSVCQDEVKCIGLPCQHGICLECLKGYIDAALGDISMFPVKCPMHHTGCKGNIESVVAKRVLSEPLYEKFIEFSDRATYGEGMRCVFCNNFVNFPSLQGQACVECPYCIQKFCIRCKNPWHYTTRCALEKVDDSLELWQASSRAQKCPACSKLIEKDGDDTCNHMIHKITDGIPCIRDRVDFCYLCGNEVTGDYPHEEVGNRGVNHFPDGVFQKCRIVMFREKEEERERLLRIRRMKNKHLNQRLPNKKVTVALGADGFDDVEIGDDLAGQNLNNLALDKFDDTWNTIVETNSSPQNSKDNTDDSLLRAALFDNPTDNADNNNNDANYFRTLNTEPPQSATNLTLQGSMIVTSPQQRRVNRPQRIRVPVGSLNSGSGSNGTTSSSIDGTATNRAGLGTPGASLGARGRTL